MSRSLYRNDSDFPNRFIQTNTVLKSLLMANDYCLHFKSLKKNKFFYFFYFN